jgi:hypothetical protein
LVQIFLSYARIDDELPSNVTDGTGFVTSLYQELYHQFRQSGNIETKIWRDIRDLDPSDQFDQVIKAAIDASSLLLVVLSPNWMQRPFCRQELDRFRDRWKQLGAEKVKHRVIVVCKRFVPFGNRPSLLQGQKGHEFFVFDGPDYSGTLFEYFQRGQPQDKRYYSAVAGLAASLSLRAERVAKNQEIEPARIDAQADDLKNTRNDAAPGRAAVGPNARKIYLAKPASDMRIAYSRLVEELSHNGHAIVPDPDKDIPCNVSATAYIDDALAEADVSIHLLGEEKGYAPEKCEPIVRLQLARAKARLAAADAHNGKNGSDFRRIIWAPETIEDTAEPADASTQTSTAEQPADAVGDRLPLEVLKQFGDFQSNDKVSDKVLGGTISKFVDFLEENLRQPASVGQGDGSVEPTADDWVYVYHVPADTDYACDLMDAFKQRGVAASLPALEGEPAELERVHKQRLAECSAVVLCWAQATEAWAHARAHELKDLKRLGRQKKFAYRGLLAGPPPGVRKTVFVKYPPANEIDVVLNLSEDRRPLTEAIDKFIDLAPAHAQ